MATRSRTQANEKEKLEKAVAATEAEQPEVANGVLVRSRVENGQLNVDVKTVGDVRVTEVETLLKLGLKAFSERIGV